MKYIIDFLDQCTTEEIDNYLSENSLVKLTTFDSFGKVFLVEGSTVPPHTELIEEVTEDKDLSIQLEDYATVTVPINEENWWKVVSYVDTPIGKDDTELKINVMDTSVDVYVFDSGIDDTHPEFEGQTINHLYSVDGDFSDHNGHGTAMASLITGNTCAITRANIHNVKVYPESGSVTLGNVLESLDIVKKHSYSTPEALAVANMSWIMEKNSYVDKKIQNLIGSGVAVVCAAGNLSTELSKFSPASVPEAFTVGSFNEEFEPCDFTNNGNIDLWAPGVNIRTAGLGDSYNIQNSGTSVSTAIATSNICYNACELSQAWSETFDVSLGKNNASVDDFLTMGTPRQGLLSLEQPHKNSKNKIVTFSRFGTTVFSSVWLQERYQTNFKVFKTQTNEFLKFFYLPEDIEKVETENLPDGLSVKNGWMVGTLQELPEGEVYKEHSFRLFLTHSNGKKTTFDCNLMQVTDKEELLSDLSMYDKKIQFILASSCGSTCTNDCALGEVCAGTGKSCFCSEVVITSDVRLKENIELFGVIEGLNVYTFNYIWSKEKQKGYMAQELLKTKYKDSVFVDESGYYAVNYSKLPPLN